MGDVQPVRSTVEQSSAKGAIIKGPYRYRLWRRWEFTSFSGTVCFIMLNPSTADALRSGERKMLEVLARGHPAKRSGSQLGTLAGFAPSGGTFRTYLGVLKRHGLVEAKGDLLAITATQDDPTIRRCVGFAKTWGFGSLEILNLFALRSTSPRALYENLQPIGPDNDLHLRAVTAMVDLIVCAWGVHGGHLGRGPAVRALLGTDRQLFHLGLTKNGAPRHPLYLKADLRPMPWEGARG